MAESETPSLSSIPQTETRPKKDVWITARIILVLLWAGLLAFTRNRFSAESLGEWLGALFFPWLLALLCSRSWRKNRRVEFSYWFLGFGLALPWLAVHHDLRNLSRPDLLKELIGSKPLERGLPEDQQEIAAVSKMLFADMKSFRAAQDKEEAKIDPDLASVDTAPSFATPTAMQSCIDAVTKKLSIDRQTSETLESWPSRAKVQLDRTDLPEDDKREYLKEFSESLSGSDYLKARRNMLGVESQWADSTVELYRFAEENAKEIHVKGDRIAINGDAAPFNSKLGKAEQLRTDFTNQAKVVANIRAANMKLSGITPDELK